MIGRGVFKNPYAFADNAAENKRFDLLRLHLDLFDQHTADHPKPFETLKRFFKIYINGFPGASELRDQLMHTKSTDEVRAILATHTFAS